MVELTTQAHMEAKKRAYWTNIISDWEKSGLTKYRFCKLKNLNSSTLYTWHKKLRSKDSNRDLVAPKQSKRAHATASKKPAFIAIEANASKAKLTVKSQASQLIIMLPNGIEIKIANATELSLVDCVKALKAI